VSGPVTIMLVMVVLEEIAVVAIYTTADLKLDVMPKHQQPKHDEHNMMCRAGRGDFGADKLGILPLLVAAIGAITHSDMQESRKGRETQLPCV
jgi:hypothetical protein